MSLSMNLTAKQPLFRTVVEYFLEFIFFPFMNVELASKVEVQS